MKKSFRIKIGYGRDEFIPITKEDLPKAYYAFLTEGKLITQDGYALRGKDIILIEPNWNEIMGWKPDHRLTGEDYQEIGVERQKYANQLMMSAKEIARQSLETGNKALLNTTPTPALAPSSNAKLLADKLSTSYTHNE